MDSSQLEQNQQQPQTIINVHQFHYELIVAHNFASYEIGRDSKIPWSIKEDLQHFKTVTTSRQSPSAKNAVVMGRKTFESLPKRPLPDRYNIVITNTPADAMKKYYGDKQSHPQSQSQQMVWFCTWQELDTVLKGLDSLYRVFIIGGEAIYNLAINTLPIKRWHVTEVFMLNQQQSTGTTAATAYFPKYDPLAIKNAQGDVLYVESVSDFKQQQSAVEPVWYRMCVYSTIDGCSMTARYINPETQYLSLMMDIVNRGIERGDRTGTGTISLFGTTQRYNLQNGFPMSTTKRMFFRGIFEELALYLSGKTDNHVLQQKGIHIWDGNTSREFLDKRGLSTYPEGDMGETYGFNFRHYGGEYKNCIQDYPDDYGYDQIANLVHLIKTDPTSRRLIINLWNPATQHKAALPACLMMYQFYVDTHAHTLNCMIYLRSSDYFLANSWNACTGALLVHLICNLEGVNLVPGELIVQTGDTHLYKTHLEQVNTNIMRQPYSPCQLVVLNKKGDLRDFKFEDVKIIGYKSHPAISAPMAV